MLHTNHGWIMINLFAKGFRVEGSTYVSANTTVNAVAGMVYILTRTSSDSVAVTLPSPSQSLRGSVVILATAVPNGSLPNRSFWNVTGHINGKSGNADLSGIFGSVFWCSGDTWIRFAGVDVYPF